MIPSASFDHDGQMLQRLQRRDRYALLLYAFSGAAIVVAGEAAAFYLGKIGIPDRILTKPEHLTSKEFAVAQKHPDGLRGTNIPRAEHGAMP